MEVGQEPVERRTDRRGVGGSGDGGLLRVRPYQPPAPSLVPERAVRLEHGGASREVRLASAAPHGRGLLLVGIAGVADRTAAEALVGSRVLVRMADLPPAADDEFYYYEVVGFGVDTVQGERVGTIAATFATGTNDVWVVQAAEREHLIPVVAEIVRAIDRAGRRVVIDPSPGLLD